MIVDHKIKIRKNQNFGKIALRNIFLRNMQIKPLSIEDAGKNQSRLLKESSYMNKGGKPIRKNEKSIFLSKTFEILALKQMLQKLKKAYAQVKVGITSENVLVQTAQII